MVHDDRGTDEDESDSAEFADVEDLIPSQEEQQAAISRVTFNWCETVREAGDRYREGASIPVLAVELEMPIEKARRAVKTYYLVFGEAPIDTVRGIVYRNGQRYFRVGLDVEELDTETRIEAEEHIQAFLGRTLLDNELDAVDIKEPVPEMEVPMPLELDVVVGSQLKRMLEPMKEEMSISGVSAGNQFLSQQLRSQITNGWQQTVSEMRKQNVRRFQQAVRATGIRKNAATPALAASAGISSVVASTAMAGVEPSMFQALGQSAAMSLMKAMQTMPEMYSSPVEQMINELSQSVAQQISQQMQSLSMFPKMQILDILEQYRLQMFSPFVEHTNILSNATAGVGTMSAVAARPEGFQGFDKPENPWSPAQPQPEPGVPDTGRDWELIDRVRAQHREILLILVSETASGTVTYLAQVYPHHQPLIAISGKAVGAMLQIVLLLALADNQ
jgi:hypothetical protein